MSIYLRCGIREITSAVSDTYLFNSYAGRRWLFTFGTALGGSILFHRCLSASSLIRYLGEPRHIRAPDRFNVRISRISLLYSICYLEYVRNYKLITVTGRRLARDLIGCGALCFTGNAGKIKHRKRRIRVFCGRISRIGFFGVIALAENEPRNRLRSIESEFYTAVRV